MCLCAWCLVFDSFLFFFIYFYPVLRLICVSLNPWEHVFVPLFIIYIIGINIKSYLTLIWWVKYERDSTVFLRMRSSGYFCLQWASVESDS